MFVDQAESLFPSFSKHSETFGELLSRFNHTTTV